MITPEELELNNSEVIGHVGMANQLGSVLLVEDDAASRRYLEILLARAGYDVVSAADGLEAMRVLLSRSVDAVITDAMMPKLNGYELCRFIKSSPKLAHLPIVLLSALDRDNATSEMAQVSVFLSKPVPHEDLLACMEQLLPQRVE